MENKTYRGSFTDKAIVDEYLTRYSEATLSSYLFNIEKHILSDFIMKQIIPVANGGTINYLDYACGTGRILNCCIEIFAKANYRLEAVGMDISEQMLATIKGCPARLVKIDITTDSAPHEKYDIITCFRFFLNAENDLRNSVLSQLHNILEKDGYLIVNNHGSCSSFLGILRYFNRQTNCLCDEQFLQILHSNGYKVTIVYALGLLPGVIVNRKIIRLLFLKFEKYLLKVKWGKIFHNFGLEKIYICKKLDS